MQDNMKRNNIRTIGIPEGEEEETNKKSLKNNGETKKQSPNERKGGNLRKNAN